MAETTPSGDRLDSWKEIAKYLNRTERTVSRWEGRGLPIHRVPGGKKQVVFAYKHELDAWLEHRQVSSDVSVPLSLEQQSIESSKELQPLSTLPSEPGTSSSIFQAEPPERGPLEHHQSDCTCGLRVSEKAVQAPWFLAVRVIFRTWKSSIVAICALSLVVFASIRLVAFHKPVAVRIARLQKLTDDGRVKINLRTDGKTLFFNEFEANLEVLAAAPAEGGPIQTIETPFANVDLQDSSRDGRTLLVTSFEGMESGGRPLWIVPANGGTPRRVGDLLCDSARWSSDNKKIACVNRNSILVLDSDGSTVYTLGSFSASPERLLWFEGDKKLRFVLVDEITRTQTPWELAVNELGTTTMAMPSRLPFGKGCCWNWTATRDGTSFLYTKNDYNTGSGLFVQLQNRWTAQEAELSLKNSPIGDLVPGKGETEIYLMVADSTRGQLLKFSPKAKVFQTFLNGLLVDCLSFSRRGQWITYIDLRDQSLWRSREDGTEAIQLTKPPMEAEFSAWSPNGRQIAFMGKQPGKPWRIFLIDKDGGAMKEAAHGTDGQGAPTWSEDGSKLVYGNVACEEKRSCWIRRIDLGTGNEELLPGSNGFHTARWSPDGKYILALQPQTHELMTFTLRTGRWKTLADSITGDNPNWSKDSQYIYIDTLKGKTPVIERVRVRDGYRETIVNLESFQKSPGHLDYWIGLAPDNSPILLHHFTAVEAYALDWALQ